MGDRLFFLVFFRRIVDVGISFEYGCEFFVILNFSSFIIWVWLGFVFDI